VIGKGGEVIQKITADLGVQIDIEDSGLIFITSVNGEAMEKAKAWIASLVEKPEVGKVYRGKITRIIPGVGAILEFLPSKDGMIHISELQWTRTENVEDVVKIGNELEAKLIEYDPVNGKSRLSLRQMSPPPEGFVPGLRAGPMRGPGGPLRGGFRGGRPGGPPGGRRPPRR
jgi:polyribonucleotide nucleotidyltransferase